MAFVSIAREDLENALKDKGFVRGPNSGFEVVYEFSHKADATLVVKVFTSIRDGRNAVRAAGEDAIRVALIWQSGRESAGLMKVTRVNRVNSVSSTLDRLTKRLREVYQEATKLRHGPRCALCGCPVWEDSGKCRNRNCQGRFVRHVGQPAPRSVAPMMVEVDREAIERVQDMELERQRLAALEAEYEKNVPEDPQLF